MMQLNEYKNISDNVYNFSVMLYKHILEDADRQNIQKSRLNGYLFLQNSFVLKKSNTNQWIFNNLDDLNVSYVLYVAETNKEYNYIMQNIDAEANSEGDYEKRSIRIISGYINDSISSDFLATICHEVNHLFEYDNGREKRIDLYDKVRELIFKDDDYASIVGNAMYYTFQHEIDAFVHQFYGFLKQEHPNHLGFEELLNYTEYKNAYNAYEEVLSNKNNPNVMKWINYLGYNRNNYFKRLKYSLKKFYVKIKNVYMRYRMENRQMTEGVIHRLQLNEKIRLEESKRYNCEIKWGIENIYNLN